MNKQEKPRGRPSTGGVKVCLKLSPASMKLLGDVEPGGKSAIVDAAIAAYFKTANEKENQ